MNVEWIRVPAGGPVEHDFEIAKYPVTNAQYAEYLRAINPAEAAKRYCRLMEEHFFGGIMKDYSPKPGFEKKPVVFVSWYDAQAFANWAGARLPSAAEWRKAAAWLPAENRHAKYATGFDTPPGQLTDCELPKFTADDFVMRRISNDSVCLRPAEYRRRQTRIVRGSYDALQNTADGKSISSQVNASSEESLARQSLPSAAKQTGEGKVVSPKFGAREATAVNSAVFYDDDNGWALSAPHLADVDWYAPSGSYGVCGMAGNVAEWVEDAADSRVKLFAGWRLTLGGSLFRPVEQTLTTAQEGDAPEKRLSTFGFRIAR